LPVVLSSISFAVCLSRLILTGMEFLRTAAYKSTNVVCMWPITSTLISLLRARKYRAIQENSQANSRPFNAKHYFHGMLVAFSNKFFFDRWLPYVLISTHRWCESEHFHVAWLPSYHFCFVLLRFIFVQIPSFSFQLLTLAMKTTVVRQRE